MPKGKQPIKAGSRQMINVRRKFKLGGRKNSVSALQLSVDELLAKYQKPSRNRDRAKVLQVLHMRGIKDIEGAIAARNAVEEAA